MTPCPDDSDPLQAADNWLFSKQDWCAMLFSKFIILFKTGRIQMKPVGIIIISSSSSGGGRKPPQTSEKCWGRFWRTGGS